MRLQHIVLAYFLIGATIWGGGLIGFDETGLTDVFIDLDGQSAQGNEALAENVSQSGGPIQEAAQGAEGGLIAVWKLFSQLVNFLFWPVSVLVGLSAPTQVVVLLGGAPTVAFYGAIFRVFRQSA